jgi:hypothetical protein
MTDEIETESFAATIERIRNNAPKKRGYVLTPDVLEIVPLLIENGMKCKEIAELFGCTASTLQVTCSKRGISLRKGGRRPPAKSLKITEAHLPLSAEASARLQARAYKAGLSEATLAAALLEVIAMDNLYDAVLDLEEVA